MAKTYEERMASAAAKIGKTVDVVKNWWVREPKKAISFTPNARKTDDAMGPTFGTKGLELYESVPDPENPGKTKMVVADLTKTLRKINRKGMSSLSSSDSMAIWKPGASSRIPAQNAMENYTGLNFASISALADEVSAISWELYQIKQSGDHRQIFDT